jgi:hypothetical protein
MHIEGKDLPQGRYLFQRYLTQNGEKVKVNTYKIERTTEGYEFYDSETKIEDELRRIELKKSKLALIWAKGSRLGLLYSIEIPKETITYEKS